jgi:hypothetical protein
MGGRLGPWGPVPFFAPEFWVNNTEFGVADRRLTFICDYDIRVVLEILTDTREIYKRGDIGLLQ